MDHIGKFLQKRARKSGMEDKDIAKYLHIAKSTLEKAYLNDEIYVSRLMKFCGIFGEDLFLEFYYEKEPLRSLRQRERETWNKKIQELTMSNEAKEKSIQYLEENNRIQNKLIASLEKDIKRLEDLHPTDNKKLKS